MEWAGKVLIGVVVVVVLLLVNGGYVYKTTCPLANGSTPGTRLALAWRQ